MCCYLSKSSVSIGDGDSIRLEIENSLIQYLYQSAVGL